MFNNDKVVLEKRMHKYKKKCVLRSDKNKLVFIIFEHPTPFAFNRNSLFEAHIGEYGRGNPEGP